MVSMRKFALLGAVLMVFLAVLAIVIQRWYVAAFPELAPGAYSGALIFQGSKKQVPWLVVRRPGEQSLAVSVGLVTVSAQRVSPIDPVRGTRQPLFVGGSDVRLRLTGTQSTEGRYEGEFLNPISQERGSWFLAKSDLTKLSTEEEGDLTRWFSLWQELEQIEGEIQESQRKIDDQTASIENLHRVVSEGDVLRKTADVRLGRTDSEMEAAVDELRTRQQQLDRKLRDFDLTQRVSKEGRLVFLSRETIQRESRWIELTLQLLAPETSVGFDEAMERAERVRGLKQAIAKEREALATRSVSGDPTKRGVDADSEGEFYEHLR
jgi:hypothetical protein